MSVVDFVERLPGSCRGVVVRLLIVSIGVLMRILNALAAALRGLAWATEDPNRDVRQVWRLTYPLADDDTQPIPVVRMT